MPDPGARYYMCALCVYLARAGQAMLARAGRYAWRRWAAALGRYRCVQTQTRAIAVDLESGGAPPGGTALARCAATWAGAACPTILVVAGPGRYSDCVCSACAGRLGAGP